MGIPHRTTWNEGRLSGMLLPAVERCAEWAKEKEVTIFNTNIVKKGMRRTQPTLYLFSYKWL